MFMTRSTLPIVVAFGAGRLSSLLLNPTSGGGETTTNPAIDVSHGKGTKNNKGWSTIDVFYGTTEHLEIPINYQSRSWYSQVLQDQVISSLLGNKTNGYFIDLAANDAVGLSNTYGLERNLNWTGLCIEANPQYWKRLAYRRCQVVGAVVGAVRDQEVLFHFKGEYGGIVKNQKETTEGSNQQKVATVPLLEIFQRHNVPREVDYLSLDVEGAESLILMQFPFSEYRIKIMTIERLDNQGRSFLKEHGYQENVRLGAIGEGLYVHKSAYASLDWNTLVRFDCKYSGIRDFECSRPFNVPNLSAPD